MTEEGRTSVRTMNSSSVDGYRADHDPLAVHASLRRAIVPATRAVFHGLRDRLRPVEVDRIDEVPSRPDLVSDRWLTAALNVATGSRVSGYVYNIVTSGTNVRGRMEVSYEPNLAATSMSTESQRPQRIFVKSTPGILTRLANAVTMAGEATFYTTLRPELNGLEIPTGYFSAVDLTTLRSIHLIEDLVATKGATFPTDPAVTLTRSQADDAVDLLADVHRIFASKPRRGLPTFVQFWAQALAIADVGKSIRAFQTDEFCPAQLRDERSRLWEACLESIRMHDHLPHTLLHNDPHRGNWYVTGAGRMGLLDWQTTCFGHWSRDLAYALPTLLTVDQRRAWEYDLLCRYRLRAELDETVDEAWLRYRQQLAGGLLFWAPTLRPPRGFPDMQPRSLAVELLSRITAAMVDHGTVALLTR